MKEGRETVWLVVPFTVGIAIVKYSLPWFYRHFFVAVAVLLAAVAALVLSIVAARCDMSGRKLWRNRLVLGSMFFFAGVAVCILANFAGLIESARFGGVSEDVLAGGSPVRLSRMRLFIDGCGERFRNMIDGMPFGDRLSNALVKALLAGDRSGLSREVRNSFRAAGASHLLALSGLHLSVIYLVISKSLSVTGNSPAAVKIRSVLIILFSGFFTLITGASPSLMRAFLFIALRECAIFTRRHTDGINIFCMSLMLQLALNPNDISSVGFQLSYLAMLGIFILNPPLERLWDLAGNWFDSLLRREGDAEESERKRKRLETGTAFGSAMRKIWSLCTISISCQVFTAPAVLLYFDTFPTYFLLTNILCLPLSNLLITTSVIAVILQLFNICPNFLLTFIDFLVHTLIYILDIISGM